MLGLPAVPDPPPAHADPEGGNPGKVLTCLECGRGFARPMHLGRHVRAAHGAPAPRP
jgi:hypothetical protein